MKPMVDLVANEEPRLTRIESGDDNEESGELGNQRLLFGGLDSLAPN